MTNKIATDYLNLPPLRSIKGVGAEIEKKLANLGVTTIEELLMYFPKKYDDFSDIRPIGEISPGLVSVKGTIEIKGSRYSRKGLHLTEAVVNDESGLLPVVWFNQPYRAASIKQNEQYYVSGNYDLQNQRLSVVNPTIEAASDVTVNESRILAIYKEQKGLTSRQIRKIISSALGLNFVIPERLPEWLVSEMSLMSLDKTIRTLHFPENNELLSRAKKRLSIEEIFHLQLATELNRQELQKEKAPSIVFDEAIAKEFVKNLPYKLTEDQRKTAWQILTDIQKTEPMNRLVEGDVGSGKTVVAALASIMVLNSGYQVLFMAPTEILARQHAETFFELLEQTPWRSTIGLLVGGMKQSEKKAMHGRIANGECRFIVGTHALLQDPVVTQKTGIVIIDEQHRFGVDQRQALRKKAGISPHVLCLTATPIPRSLSLTLYGELDLSIIQTMPSGRLETHTEIVLFPARSSVYKLVDEQIELGRQVFAVCPLINESESLQAKAAESLYEELSTKLLRHRRIAIVHGGMKPSQKDEVMTRFAAGDIDVLVATTVIEVGVNVPNASVMVVEGAERFGLAQLHQLRGRIGRGNHQGYCFLIPSQDIGMTKRMRAISSTNNGFKLAEMDLQLRGPGAIYGTRQSGSLDLQFADVNDRALVANAKLAAREFIERRESLVHYRYIAERVRHFQHVSRLN